MNLFRLRPRAVADVVKPLTTAISQLDLVRDYAQQRILAEDDLAAELRDRADAAAGRALAHVTEASKATKLQLKLRALLED